MSWLTGWDWRQKITIASSGAGLSANVANQPISIPVAAAQTAFWSNVLASGNDVRFTDSDGTTLLNYEIVKFDHAGTDARYKVLVPSVTSGADTVIYLYYGSAGAVAGENRTATWPSSYKGVWHLDANSSLGAFGDSTSNGNNGTNTATTDAAGQDGRGRAFSGTSQYISCGDVLDQAANAAFSLAVNFKRGDTGRLQQLLSKMDATANLRGYEIYFNASNLLIFLIRSTNTHYIMKYPTSGYTDTTGYHDVGIDYDGSATAAGVNIYFDGALVSATTVGKDTLLTTDDVTNAVSLNFGADSTGANDLNGIEDEIEFTNAVRGANGWKVRYQSQLGTWLTYGASENAGIAAITTDDVTVAATGIVENVGAAAITTDDVTVAGTGAIENAGAAAITTDDATVAATGNSGGNIGSAAITTDDVTIAATGELQNIGAAAITTDDVTVAATGIVENVGAAAITTDDAVVAAAGTAGTVSETLGFTAFNNSGGKQTGQTGYIEAYNSSRQQYDFTANSWKTPAGYYLALTETNPTGDTGYMSASADVSVWDGEISMRGWYTSTEDSKVKDYCAVAEYASGVRITRASRAKPSDIPTTAQIVSAKDAHVIDGAVTDLQLMQKLLAYIAGKRHGLVATGTPALEQYFMQDGTTPAIQFSPTDAAGNGTPVI